MSIIILLFLVNTVSASALFAIGMQGISQASPEIASIISNVLCVSNPLGCIQGKLIGAVQSEAMTALAEQNPEMVAAFNTYNQVETYVDAGAEITQDLQVDETGKITEGIIEFKEKEARFGDLIGKDIEQKEIFGKEIEINKKYGTSTVSFTGENSYINVKGDLFKDIKTDEETEAYIKLNEDGEVTEADITASTNTSFVLGNRKYDVPEGTHIIYNNGQVSIQGQDGDEIGLVNKITDENGDYTFSGANTIKLGKDGLVKINGNEISGKNFEIDGITFLEKNGKEATVFIYGQDGIPVYDIVQGEMIIPKGVQIDSEGIELTSESPVSIEPMQGTMDHNTGNKKAMDMESDGSESMGMGNMKEYKCFITENGCVAARVHFEDGMAMSELVYETNKKVLVYDPNSNKNYFIGAPDYSQIKTGVFFNIHSIEGMEDEPENIIDFAKKTYMKNNINNLLNNGMPLEEIEDNIGIMGYMPELGFKYEQTLKNNEKLFASASTNIYKYLSPPAAEGGMGEMSEGVLAVKVKEIPIDILVAVEKNILGGTVGAAYITDFRELKEGMLCLYFKCEF